MPTKLKLTLSLFVLVLLPIALLSIYNQHIEGVNFEAEGIVVDAKWHTRQHDMSLFLIRGKYGTKKLQNHRVILEPSQIKIGDKFKKESGSKICLVNNVEIVCVK